MTTTISLDDSSVRLKKLAIAEGSSGWPARQKIRFYLPFRRDGLRQIPESPNEYWQWLLEHPNIFGGRYSWTLQTYLWLRQGGLPCEIVEELPEDGIVVAHRDSLPVFLRMRPGIFLICIKADRNMHSWAHFHVVQNDNDPLRLTEDGKRRSATMPLWPQAGLVSRDPNRGQRCENIAFFGRPLNLANELRDNAWAAELQRRGMRWITPKRAQWNDYRDIDVTVSVRVFGEQSDSVSAVLDIDSKPPSKLINSWLAGVPAIVGCEPAFKRVRRSELDFIEVASVEELRVALARLRENPQLYRDMVENGRQRAQEFSADAITALWMHLFRELLTEQYTRWSAQGRLRRSCVGYWRCATYFSKLQHLKSIFGALGK